MQNRLIFVLESFNMGAVPNGEEIQRILQLMRLTNESEIGLKEVGQVYQALGFNPSESELEEIQEMLDVNNTGKVLVGGLVKVIQEENPIEKHTKEFLMDAFRAFDKTGDGKIPREELERVLTSLGEPLEDEELKSFMLEADTNNESTIAYEPFISLLLQKFNY
eukprot:m.21151 g.21151  ORF g.21151 m.21151 type:complete len:164 (-) comp7052_c0_seq1:8-499(-)